MSRNPTLISIRDRHSIRVFADRPVSDEDILTALHAANQAPSAHNQQTWRLCYKSSVFWQHRLQSLYGDNKLFVGHGFSRAVTMQNRYEFTGCGKTRNSVILSEAKNLSLFLFLYLNRRGILRFAQNDRTRPFFRNHFQPLAGFLNRVAPQHSKLWGRISATVKLTG